MNTTDYLVDRFLPCPCAALTDTPWPACPECEGAGEAWQEVELVVEFAYHKSRGARDRYGCPLEPDDEQLELLSVTDEHGREVDLDTREEDRAVERCLESMGDVTYAED